MIIKNIEATQIMLTEVKIGSCFTCRDNEKDALYFKTSVDEIKDGVRVILIVDLTYGGVVYKSETLYVTPVSCYICKEIIKETK